MIMTLILISNYNKSCDFKRNWKNEHNDADLYKRWKDEIV